MSWCPFFHWVVIFLPASQWNLLEYVIEHLIPFRLHLLNWIGLSETIVLVTSHSYLEFLIVANLMLAPVHVLNDPHFKIVVDLLVWSNRIIGELADLAATSLVENAFAKNIWVLRGDLGVGVRVIVSPALWVYLRIDWTWFKSDTQTRVLYHFTCLVRIALVAARHVVFLS